MTTEQFAELKSLLLEMLVTQKSLLLAVLEVRDLLEDGGDEEDHEGELL